MNQALYAHMDNKRKMKKKRYEKLEIIGYEHAIFQLPLTSPKP
jgi:hypothetical protein